MSYKSIDGLMRHLRDNGIAIAGSSQKRQLINFGYFHGYKGYRFFKKSNNPIPFSSYVDINATIKYDSELKALFYGKLMFIETAVKNIALNRIMLDSKSENIQEMLKKVVAGYHSFPNGTDNATRKKAQKAKLNLENRIQGAILRAYNNNNPQITHFYNSNEKSYVPLWALFEILTLGDFANLLSCLTFDTRDNISSDLGINNPSIDSNRELIYNYLYVLKELRNAVAHNSVVFDTRFRSFDPSKAMKKFLQQEFHLSDPVNFQTIDDYVILIFYYLKILKVPKHEIRAFLREFEHITDVYINTVDSKVSNIVVNSQFLTKLTLLKNSI